MLSIRRRNSIAPKTIFRNFLSRNVLRLSFERPKLSRRSSTGAACSDFASHSLFMRGSRGRKKCPRYAGTSRPAGACGPQAAGTAVPLSCAAQPFGLALLAASTPRGPSGPPPLAAPPATNPGLYLRWARCFSSKSQRVAWRSRQAGPAASAAEPPSGGVPFVGQARSAQPMHGPSAHTFCLFCCLAALCPVVLFRTNCA